MKLLSGRALSTPEGTQASHRLSVRPAGAAVRPVPYCRFEIQFHGGEQELALWAAVQRSTWLLFQVLLTLVSSSTFPSLVIRECIRSSGLPILNAHTAPYCGKCRCLMCDTCVLINCTPSVSCASAWLSVSVSLA